VRACVCGMAMPHTRAHCITRRALWTQVELQETIHKYVDGSIDEIEASGARCAVTACSALALTPGRSPCALTPAQITSVRHMHELLRQFRIYARSLQQQQQSEGGLRIQTGPRTSSAAPAARA
jgi:hypothetical protein